LGGWELTTKSQLPTLVPYWTTFSLHRHDKAAGWTPVPEAYLDTSAFIAFLDKSDSYHTTFRRLFASPPGLATSAPVMAEGHGWFLRRYDRHRAGEFLAFLDALPTLAVQAFDATELSKTRLVLARFGDQNLTLADAHGLVVMKDRLTTVCWSTDRHLGLTGVELAISSQFQSAVCARRGPTNSDVIVSAAIGGARRIRRAVPVALA